MYEIFMAYSLERPTLYYGQRRSDPWVVVLKSFHCTWYTFCNDRFFNHCIYCTECCTRLDCCLLVGEGASTRHWDRWPQNSRRLFYHGACPHTHSWCLPRQTHQVKRISSRRSAQRSLVFVFVEQSRCKCSLTRLQNVIACVNRGYHRGSERYSRRSPSPGYGRRSSRYTRSRSRSRSYSKYARWYTKELLWLSLFRLCRIHQLEREAVL